MSWYPDSDLERVKDNGHLSNIQVLPSSTFTIYNFTTAITTIVTTTVTATTNPTRISEQLSKNCHALPWWVFQNWMADKSMVDMSIFLQEATIQWLSLLLLLLSEPLLWWWWWRWRRWWWWWWWHLLRVSTMTIVTATFESTSTNTTTII